MDEVVKQERYYKEKLAEDNELNRDIARFMLEDAGMNEHFTKPLNMREVIAKIEIDLREENRTCMMS